MRIHLLASDDRLLDSAHVGGLCATGSFSHFRLEPPRTVLFRFIDDAEWTVEVLDAPKPSMPWWPDARGAWRGSRMARRFPRAEDLGLVGRPQTVCADDLPLNVRRRTDLCQVTLEEYAMPPTLQLGSYGEAVKVLQGALNLWAKSSLAQLAVDGAFGPKTHGKVTEFQSRSNLKPDGMVGPLTWTELEPLVQMIKGIVPIPVDEAAAGERIAAGAEAALGVMGWTAGDQYSPMSMKIAAAKCANNADPLRPRQGGLALVQMFAIAQVPGAYQGRCPTISIQAVLMWQQQTQAGTFWRNNNDLCAWCGIFAVYVLRSVGFSVPQGWASQETHVQDALSAFHKGGGSGPVYRLFTDPTQAFRGCIGVINPSSNNHHFIVTGNRGRVIASVDGNASGFGLDPDPKMKFDCKSVIARNTYTHSALKTGQAYFLFPAPGNR